MNTKAICLLVTSLLAGCASAPTKDNGPHLKRIGPGTAEEKLVCFDAGGTEVPTPQCPPVPYNYYVATNALGAPIPTCEDGTGRAIAVSHCKAICVDGEDIRVAAECKSVPRAAISGRVDRSAQREMGIP